MLRKALVGRSLGCSGLVCAALFNGLAAAAPGVHHLPASAAPFDTSAEAIAHAQALTLATPAGAETFSLSSESPEAGMTGLRGHSASGDRLYLFVAGSTIQSGYIYGSQGAYRLVAFQNRNYWVPVASHPELDISPAPASNPDADVAFPAFSGSPAAVAPKSAPGPDGKYLIDVLVLYTPTHQKEVGDERAHIQDRIFHANSIMDNSKVPVHYRLVGLRGYNGINESADFYDNIAAMAVDGNVTAWRNGSAADIVALLRSRSGTNENGISGLSSPFNGAEQSFPPDNVNANRDAFIVVDSNSSRTTFAHELGHVLGGGHEYAKGAPSYWRPYAHAWVCGSSEGQAYTSLMISTNIATGGANGTTLTGDFISNPELIADGNACGTDGVDGVEGSQANNARSMTEAAPYVAAYRGGKAGEMAKASSAAVAGAIGLMGLLGLVPGLMLRGVRRRNHHEKTRG